jgi:hypothetical protein
MSTDAIQVVMRVDGVRFLAAGLCIRDIRLLPISTMCAPQS